LSFTQFPAGIYINSFQSFLQEVNDMTQRFAHQSVIVTGAGSGIGLATVSGFAQEGASVMVADLSARRAQAAVEAIQAQGVLPFGVKWMLPNLTMWKAQFKQRLTPLGGSTSW
jgi:threonine dehydrogenase-like Zn-dependent dehydrogenase